MYLTEADVRRTLRSIATGCEARTVLFFDHLPTPRKTANEDARRAFAAQV